ncbi:hypothetical protein MIU24_09345 [Streptomyces venezuelae]|uniref:hypothetical protein n=2 Tax=unclassified Streptomyces TaxID=2593676 RepID=UPI00311F9346
MAESVGRPADQVAVHVGEQLRGPVTVFAWAMAVGTPLMAGLLRRRGLGTTLRLSAVLVAAGTAVVAVAPWLPLAMTGRAAQAVGGAGLVTAAMSLAGSVRRMGVITAGFGTLGAVGPLLGSTLAAAASWRVSLAVGALAPLTAALTPWAPLLLPVATLAVLATSAGQAVLAVYATRAASADQRPTAIGLFSLAYQLGGAFGPAIAALITLGA